MGLSDVDLDRITAALDHGDVVNAGVVRDLAEEVKASRAAFGQAAKAVEMATQASIDMAKSMKEILDQHREGINKKPPVILSRWPAGFNLPEVFCGQRN